MENAWEAPGPPASRVVFHEGGVICAVQGQGSTLTLMGMVSEVRAPPLTPFHERKYE
jgi:hypothetical protein